MMTRCLACVLMAFTLWQVSAAEPASSLSPPTKIIVGGKPIDASGGLAAPFVGDFKGDGVMSLLVGQGNGKLLICTNKGSKTEPRFETSFPFLDGQSDGWVPTGPEAGFTPQLAAYDQVPSILSGSSAGELYLFRGKAKGAYAAAETIKDKTDNPITVGEGSTVFAFNWRGTGKLDLIVGTKDGSVYLIPNDGTDKKAVYGRPKKLEADGKAIKVPLGHSHPVVADWDKDGKPDLIVGTGVGSVLWYRNISTGGEPRLAAAQTLVPESPLAKNKDAILKDGELGLNAKVCVVDWNGDGWLDLLVGDSYLLKPMMTEAEQAAETKAKADLAKLEKDYAKGLQDLKALEKVPAKETDAAKKEREMKVRMLKVATKQMQKEVVAAEKALTKVEKPAQYHGNVWLFLRKPEK